MGMAMRVGTMGMSVGTTGVLLESANRCRINNSTTEIKFVRFLSYE